MLASIVARQLWEFLLTGFGIGAFLAFRMRLWLPRLDETWLDAFRRSGIFVVMIESLALFGFFVEETRPIWALSKAYPWWGSLLVSWALCTAVWLMMVFVESRRSNRLIVSLVQADVNQPTPLPVKQARWASLGLAAVVIWSLLALAKLSQH